MPELPFIFRLDADAVAQLILDTSIKGTFLLALAGIAARLAVRGSAALRHQIWFAGFAGLLALPLLAVVSPQWEVLPAWAELPKRTAVDSVQLEHSTPAARATGGVIQGPKDAVAPVRTANNVNLYIAVIWATGFAWMLLRLAGGLIWLRISVRNAEPATEAFLASHFHAACVRLDLRNVELRLDSRRPVPFVCGIFRRFLVLPAAARDWPAARLRAVLSHELAHFKRHDPILLFISSVTCALHWCNPVVWLAARELALEREKACDDYVLNTRIEPADYATHLLAASWFAHESETMVLAMTRRSQLERRIVAALDVRSDRSGLSPVKHLATLLLGASLVIPLAMARPRELHDVQEPTLIMAARAPKTLPSSRKSGGPFIAIDVQTNGTSAIILDELDLPQITRTLQRVASQQSNSLVLIRHIGNDNHLQVVKLAQLCRGVGLRSTFIANFSTNTAPHLPPDLQALPSRNRFIPVNVQGNGKFALRAEGFGYVGIVAELSDLKSTQSAVLVRSSRSIAEFGDVSLAVRSMARAMQ